MSTSKQPDGDLNAQQELQFLRAENEQLKRQLIALERDAARLDWLADRDNPFGQVLLPNPAVLMNVHSLRGAIDTTMQMAANGELEEFGQPQNTTPSTKE